MNKVTPASTKSPTLFDLESVKGTSVAATVTDASSPESEKTPILSRLVQPRLFSTQHDFAKGITLPARSEAMLQRTLFSRFDPQNFPDLSKIIPPVCQVPLAKARSFEARMKRRDLSFPVNVDFAEQVISSPHAEFAEKLIWKREQFPTRVRRDDGTEVAVPATIAEAVDRYGLHLLRAEKPRYMSEQFRGLTIAMERSQNLMFQADTSFGKTFVELLIAAAEIHRGCRVLLLTTREELVEQIARDELEAFFNLPQSRYAEISGATPVTTRSEALSDPSISLVISTPDAFYFQAKKKPELLRAFNVCICDEGHKIVGKTLYRKVASALADSDCRMRVFSATLPDKEERRVEMLDSLKIDRDRIYRLHSSEKAIFRTTEFLRIRDSHMLSAATELYRMAAKTAVELYRALVATLNTDESWEKRAVAQAIRALVKATRMDRGKFSQPGSEQCKEIDQRLMAIRSVCGDEFRRILSLWAQYQHRMHLYSTLTVGKFSFLNFAADSIYSHRFNTTRSGGKEKGWYFSEIYNGIERGSDLAKIYSTIAKKDSLYELLVTVRSFHLIKQALAERGVEAARGSASPQALKDIFFEHAMRELVEDRDWYDGPTTESVLQLVRRHTTFGRSDQTLIYVESSALAIFYSKLIERILIPLDRHAVAFTGVLYMSRDERRENLWLFKNGKAVALSGTSAIREGLNSRATVMIVASQAPSTEAKKQLRGRIGRSIGGEMSIGIEYDLVRWGTPEYARFYVGWLREKKVDSIARMES